MLISLLTKEFKLSSKGSSLTYTILSWILKIVLLGLEIALTCFMVRTLDNKILTYSPIYGSLDFLVVLLFLVFVIITFYGLLKLRKSLYDARDTYILNTLPIYDDKIILIKMVKLFLTLSVDALFICMPILITYGSNRVMNANYYVFTFFYPFLMALVSIGIDFILVSLFEFLYRFLKNKEILQFVLASILMIGLCYLYKIFLELFLNCLSDSSIGNVFSDDLILNLNKIGKYLFPVSNVIYPIFEGKNSLAYSIILVGFIMLLDVFGYLISTFFYSHFSKTDSVSFNGISSKKEKINSINIALIKKELNLIFRDSSSIFSYTSLLIMMPFLTYVVVSALNTIIFSNLRVLTLLYPNLDDSIVNCLIILFISTINSSNSMISKEKRNIVTIKILPVSPLKMIVIKAIVPLCLSLISLLATTLTLYITSCISLQLFIFSSICGIMYIVGTTFLGIKIDMHDLGNNKTKLSNVYYYVCLLIPVILLVINMCFDLLRLASYYSYIVNIAIYLGILVYVFIFFKKRTYKSFDSMEINNI